MLRWCAAGIHPLSVPRAPSPPSLSLSPTPPSLSPPHPTLSLSLPHPAVDRLAVSTLVVPADHLAGGAGGGGRGGGGGKGLQAAEAKTQPTKARTHCRWRELVRTGREGDRRSAVP